MLGRSFFYAGGPSVCHIPLFLCCRVFFFMLHGASSYSARFWGRGNPHPDPWEDPKVDSTTPVVRVMGMLCRASSYAARLWGL